MRAAGALARRGPRRRAALSRASPSPAGLPLAPGARPLFGWVKRWAGVPERDAQISELRAENAAQIEALGDMQARGARTMHPWRQAAPR